VDNSAEAFSQLALAASGAAGNQVGMRKPLLCVGLAEKVESCV
jgi:hypothetical protein